MEKMNRFDEKLARIFEATQAKGDTALANILGIKPPSVAAARKRRQIPTGWVEDIAERFHISADWLFFGRGPMLSGQAAPSAPTTTPPTAGAWSTAAQQSAKGHRAGGPTPCHTTAFNAASFAAELHAAAAAPFAPLPSDASPANLPELHFIPRVAARLNAGSTSLHTHGAPHSATPDMFAFRADWLARMGDPASMVLLDITGNAMAPEIKHGDMVLIDQSKTSVLSYGYFAVSVDETVMVKQLRVRPGKLVLHSLLKDDEDIEVDMKDECTQQVRILGRVIWVGRALG